MTGPEPAPATFYRPAEVAAMLRCSEWWVKEQARHRRIPFCWIGGGYKFTDAHLAEIARLFEVRPTEMARPAVVVEPVVRRPAESQQRQDREPVVRLRARTPRRARNAATPDPSAA
jgi:hypothetical protein